MTTDLKALEGHINYAFQDAELLALALTHPSCEALHGNNQRLEFLGDAVLGLIIAEALYRENPDLEEGALDHMRAVLVNGKALAATARLLDLGKVLQVSDAQQQHNAEHSDSMLEDALEALIGAVYLDGGLEAARRVVLGLFKRQLAGAADAILAGNPKGRLQEWSQKQYAGAIPEYVALSESGPDHARLYVAAVHLNGAEAGRGEGPSKKVAESAAAQAALTHLGI